MRQVDLAYRANIQPSTVSHIETGETVPNVRLLATIAEALGVDIRDLFPPPEPPKPPNPRSKPKSVARELAQMSADTGAMSAYANAWAGPGRGGLARLERLRLVARHLTLDDGPNPATAGVAATAAYWGRVYELREAGVISEEEAQALRERAA